MQCNTYRDLITCMIAGAVAGLVVVTILAPISLYCHYKHEAKNLESALMLEDPNFGAKVFALHCSRNYDHVQKMITLAKEYWGDDYQYDGQPLANASLMVKILTREQYYVSQQGRIEPIK